MWYFKSYICVIVIIVILATLTTVDGLYCWQCSTEESNGQFCSDPFKSDYFIGKRENYLNCDIRNLNINSQIRAACKKIDLEVDGKIFTRRICSYENINDPPDQCYYDDVPFYFKTVFCETCLTDGCNSANKFLPRIVYILISILILKIIIN